MINQKYVVSAALLSVFALVVLPACRLASASFSRTRLDLEPTSTVLEIRSKGYLAHDFYIPVQDSNYYVNIVKATNPLINDGDKGAKNKLPLVFIHGILVNANCYIIDGEGVKPEDFSDLNAGEMSDEELEDLLRNEPSRNSLVYLALNFGHEVYLLNRRSTVQSRTHQRSSKSQSRTFNNIHQDQYLDVSYFLIERPSYWNFTADDQALNDIPESINFALKSSGRKKVGLISHSLGGGLSLMSLIAKPNLGSKVSTALLWAPALNNANSLRDGNFGSIPFLLSITEKLAENVLGAFPPEPLVPMLKKAIAAICGSNVSAKKLCAPILDLILGQGSFQQNYELLSNRLPFFDASGLRELAQISQSIKRNKMHFYDFGSRSKNMEVYGQLVPPTYNVSRIRDTTIHLVAGNKDTAVAKAVIESIQTELRVPMTSRTIGDSSDDISFNHLSFMFHKDVANLLYIPSIKLLESSQKH